MNPTVESREHHRRLLAAVVTAVLALVVGVGAGVDAHASTQPALVAGTRVAAHEASAGSFVEVDDAALAGGGRRTTTSAAEVVVGSRVAPRSTTGVADDLCRANSFVPATLVLMADGSTKPIADVQIGDMVIASDPETGDRGPRRVTDTIVGDGIKDLVDIEIDGNVVTATDRHPFWIDDQGRWVDAEDLDAGDVLLLADGDTVEVDGVTVRTEVRRVHNLTVEGIHTYYVLAGDEAVLVHNCAQPSGLGGASRGLESLFEGVSARGRSIIGIRSGLLDDGFTQGLTNNHSGYLFRNTLGEEVRIMSRNSGWDIRIRNQFGNYLDELGNVASPSATHGIPVYSR